MYTDYQLKTNPSFRMTKEEFNSLVNSITTEGEKKIKLGLVVRTKNSNEIALEDNSILFTRELTSNMQGYFSVLASCQLLLGEKFNISTQDMDTIKHTIFMPVGAFENKGEIIIYCNLIIEEEVIESFKTNASIKFVSIGENTLNNLDDRSIIVLPTITIVK